MHSPKNDFVFFKQTVFVLVVMTVFMVLVATEIVLYSRNTLKAHPQWISGNLLLASPSMGAHFSATTRNLLKQNRLNLQEWHGFQEILLNKVFQLGAMKLKLRLGENASVSLIYNKSGDSFSGVRLSRNGLYGNIFFKADNDGEFLEKRALNNLIIDNKWHEVELRFHQSELQLIWDGVLIDRIPEISREEQVIGFRSGGPFETIIDDVYVVDDTGKVIISENFRNSNSYWRLFLLLLVFSTAAVAFVFFIASIAGFHPRATANWVFLIQISMTIILLFYLCFDYSLYSNLYPYADVKQWKSVSYRLNSIENMRSRLFSLFSCCDADVPDNKAGDAEIQPKEFLQSTDDDIGPAGFLKMQVIWSGSHGEEIRIFSIPQLVDFFGTMPLESFYKIIFLGTSQTWGEGAALRKRQMVFQAYRYLRTMYDNDVNLLVVNAGLRAADSNAMVKILRAVFDTMRPEMVVVNLSNNDETLGFKENLLEMHAVSSRNKTKIIFIKEANSPDSDNIKLLNNHQVIDEITSEKSIPCIDMHAYLSSPSIVDSGFLWWDFVHLTSYGQATAGKAIAREIHRIIELHPDSPHAVKHVGLRKALKAGSP